MQHSITLRQTFFGFFGIAAALVSTGLVQAAQKDVALTNEHVLIERMTFNDDALQVVYFAHNGPNIKEFVAGKEKVASVLLKLQGAGFSPLVSGLRIGIAPRNMSGGPIAKDSDALYVSLFATEDQIERALIEFFRIVALDDRVLFRAHFLAPSIDEFLKLKARIEAVVGVFSESGLGLNLPSPFRVVLSAKTMSGGEIVEGYEEYFISQTASDDQIERFLTKFVRAN